MKFLTVIATSITLAAISFTTGAEAAVAASCSAVYGQCGGGSWTGPTCCQSGSTCVKSNEYYSQCLPSNNNGGSSTTTTTTRTTTTATPTSTGGTSNGGYTVIANGLSGNGQTTRYWDCCKGSCSWPGKASVSAPVGVCAKDGVTLVDPNTASGCNGGSGFMCNNNQPWAVNDNLSYGFAAANLAGSSESGWCCGCYELTFTSGPVSGKKLVVQITNTGGDLGNNHFDLEMPGGGVGLFNGCQAQWGAPSDGWGARYGGVSSASDCAQLPSALQPGCNWRFNWFKNADNPSVTFKEVTCPAELVARTGCKRN